jgi:hypothetical protein
MPKTPGTHEHDDSSQQPSEKKTPKKSELSEMNEEDHAQERQQLAHEQLDPKPRTGAKKG